MPGAFRLGTDAPILTGIWVLGTILIARKSSKPIPIKQATAIAAAAVSGVSLFLGGALIASRVFKALPDVGLLETIGIKSSLNAFFTYRYMRAVAKVYDKYDNEEMIHRVLASGVPLLLVSTLNADVEEMTKILASTDSEAVTEVIADAQKLGIDLSNVERKVRPDLANLCKAIGRTELQLVSDSSPSEEAGLTQSGFIAELDRQSTQMHERIVSGGEMELYEDSSMGAAELIAFEADYETDPDFIEIIVDLIKEV